MVFFNEKKGEIFEWFLTSKIDFKSQILAHFDTSPLHQFSKFNNFLWTCWFSGKNLSNFVNSKCSGLNVLFITWTHISDRQYATYLYNDIEESINEKLKFTLPSWVILHALKLLEKQKTNENEEIVKEMSNNSTNVEDLFGDQPIVNQDLKSNSESTLLKRSVSTQPQMSQISEQENETDKDAMLKKLQKKINVLQSNLQELQELINQSIE